LPENQGPSDRPEWLTKATTPSYCYRHPDRQTGLRCSRCDRPICGECANPAPVGQLCPDDARSTVRARGLPSDARPLATWTLLGINTLMLFAAAALVGGTWQALLVAAALVGGAALGDAALVLLGGAGVRRAGDRVQRWVGRALATVLAGLGVWLLLAAAVG
jgi:hypothetical protein